MGVELSESRTQPKLILRTAEQADDGDHGREEGVGHEGGDLQALVVHVVLDDDLQAEPHMVVTDSDAEHEQDRDQRMRRRCASASA